MKLYKLLESDRNGYFNLHTGWIDKETAEEMRDRYARLFPDSDWIIEEHHEEDTIASIRNTPKDACDGWEDMYPDRDDY